ncbi:ComEC/Rec2 family competence protein [soil metagenome]
MRVTTADRDSAEGEDIGSKTRWGRWVGAGLRAWGGVSSTRPAAAHGRVERALIGMRAEATAQVDRWTLWTPVAFGGGAATYIGLRREPDLAVSVAVAAGLILCVAAARWWGRSRGLVIAVSLLAFGSAGFAAGVVKARLVAAPVAPADRKPVTVEGWVVDVVSVSGAKPRLLIAPTYVSGLSDAATPKLVRVSLRDPEATLGPGQPVRLRAILGPPPPPAAPEAYDFARDAYFARIGGSGLAVGAPQVIGLPEPGALEKLQLAINAGRWSLARRLVARMGERDGGLAAALTTGHQAWLQDADVQAMRDSGLAHILSISGVHMAIVGGFVFGLVRLLIAAWPWAALRVSGKKVATAARLVAVSAYLVLSGAPPPAIRSALTASIAFLAVLFDRRALSLPSLAVAALVVLTFQPEAVAQPGFQMSFAATAALLALAEAWPHRSTEVNAPLWIRTLQGVRTWLVAGAAVSLVAGLATDPFGIEHFNRVTLYGLPANVASELLSSFVVMPMLAVGAVAELFGVGAPFLAAAGWGLEAVAGVARLFAAAPRAVVWLPSASTAALAISFIGLLIICLWRGRLRWLGAPLFLAVWAWPRPPTPDLWIAPEGANVAIHDGRRAVALRPRAQKFGLTLWAHRRALTVIDDPDEATNASDAFFDCGRDSCSPKPSAPVQVALWSRRIPADERQMADLCRSADVVVVRTGEPDSAACDRNLVLGEAQLARGGAAELWRTTGGWRVVWSEPLRGVRPWTAPQSPVEPSDSGG